MTKAIRKLSEDDRTKLSAALILLPKTFISRTEFSKSVIEAAKSQGLNLPATGVKALIGVFGFRSDEAEICLDSKGKNEADPDARVTEDVPFGQDVDEYFAQEVKPFAPDGWIDSTKEKIGYEIPFTRYFYKYFAPRDLAEIDAELNSLVADIQSLLREIEQ